MQIFTKLYFTKWFKENFGEYIRSFLVKSLLMKFTKKKVLETVVKVAEEKLQYFKATNAKQIDF